MVRPLTKRKTTGDLYQRPAEVTAAIEATQGLSRAELLRRCRVSDPASEDFLRPECLVYMIRAAQGDGDEELSGGLLSGLFQRCSAMLMSTIPNARSQRAADARQQVLDRLADKFLADAKPDALDMFEVRFGVAFRSLRIDVLRSVTATEVDLVPLVEDENDPSSDLRAEPVTHDARHTLARAIWQLPAELRRAYILVNVYGYEIESVDPETETAATKCGVSGRAIRDRLAKAKRELQSRLEGK